MQNQPRQIDAGAHNGGIPMQIDGNSEKALAARSTALEILEPASSLLAMTEQQREVINPAVAYLLTLPSPASKTTMKSFLNCVARLVGYRDLMACPWETIQRHHVQAIITMLSDSGKTPATVNTYLAAIKGVALEAWAMKLIDSDSYQHIKQVKSVRGSRLPSGRALSPAEIQALMAACENDDSPIGIRDAAMIAVLAGCGLRRTEIVSLDFETLSITERSFKVLGKGNKERLSFIPSGAWSRLSRWLEHSGHGQGALFTRIRRHDAITDGRLSAQAIYHILHTRAAEAQVEKFSPHDLRRTYATTLFDKGVDIITVKDALGHESVSTTQKYDKRGTDRMKQASEHINYL